MGRGSEKSVFGRYLLKGDSHSKTKTKSVLDNYFRTGSGLIMPSRDRGTCGGCGVELYRVHTSFYMGEFFCSKCVEKWMQGEK